ncbi:hypothetical protein BpHYR1_026368 [Brachionus plicatilis]|uniref:Uncharacterized protein n=1 Tax=Brachionus plicatilis TaxID=10195 RepID=A0A3M7SDT7_BRAPC|nr:hypothetical protein BpHYR1_026368 [Brachionus plicatilis]
MEGKLRILERLPDNFDYEGLESVKKLARRFEAYAIHLELERKNDALKLNRLKDDLYNCEIGYKKLKSQNAEISKINERFDSEKEQLSNELALEKNSHKEKSEELELAKEKIHTINNELFDERI